MATPRAVFAANTPRTTALVRSPAWFKAFRLLPLALCSFVLPCRGQWTPQESGTTARLRGLCVVSPTVVWASGSEGACLRSIDGGKTWGLKRVPGGTALDFRDVQAIDAKTAYLLSIGAGDQSRIYKTTDGGSSWTLQYQNRDPRVFLDAIAFWDADHGLVLGDPVAGRFVVLTTDDGGKAWRPIAVEGMPPALPDEGAFAASGTCLVTKGTRSAWFGTGGARVARVFRSTDGGTTWTAHPTPVKAGLPSSGIFALAFWDQEKGIAVGGDYKNPDEAGTLVALTRDGGQTWAVPNGRGLGGYRSGVAAVPTSTVPVPSLLAVGPSGVDWSADAGENWTRLGPPGFDAVGFAARTAGWAVGEGGRIARFDGARVQGR